MSASRKIRDRNVLVVYAAVLLVGIAYGASTGVLSIHLKGYGFGKGEMGGLAAAFATGIVATSLPAGWLVRHLTAKRTLLFALLGYAITTGTFPMFHTFVPCAISRFLDGGLSVCVWVACETVLLERARDDEKAYVMSLYAMCFAGGYIVGPLVARPLVDGRPTGLAFWLASALALASAAVVQSQLERANGQRTSASGERPADAERRPADVGQPGEDSRPPLSGGDILWRIKNSCFATFGYGYFQASVVLFLPLFLIEKRGVPENDTILITAFFAAGMLLFTSLAGRIGDRLGHLYLMRVLATVGTVMILSFVFLTKFWLMCGAVFVAGATLASISPVSLALLGVVTPKRDLARGNAIYNAFYAGGMLLGPPTSSFLFTTQGGEAMLYHLAALWCAFVLFTLVFMRDDPAAARRAAARRAALPG